MFFSVIIPTFNRSDILNKTLDSLFNQSVDLRDYEVIVVNDGSTDDTAKVTRKFSKKYKNFHYIKQRNQGQGVARNTGFKKAKGEVIVLIGDDIIPTYDFLYEHQKYHYLHPEENAGVLGFTAWHPELKLNNFMRWMVNGSSILGRFGGHQFAYEKLKNGKLADFNFFYTSNISLKRSLLKKFTFDSKFAGYGWEDIELGYRLFKEADFKLYYNSWAVGYHHHYMDEDSFPRRMMAIGNSAWLIHQKYPELQKIPGFWKKFIFQIISFGPFIWLLWLIKKLSKNKIYNLYYYASSKKYFLQGIRTAKNKKN